MRFKILVIDDEPILRNSLEIALKASGYDVTTAGSGEEGLKLFQKENPDLVLRITGCLELTGTRSSAGSKSRIRRCRSLS